MRFLPLVVADGASVGDQQHWGEVGDWVLLCLMESQRSMLYCRSPLRLCFGTKYVATETRLKLLRIAPLLTPLHPLRSSGTYLCGQHHRFARNGPAGTALLLL
jgi:hypothetical protein